MGQGRDVHRVRQCTIVCDDDAIELRCENAQPDNRRRDKQEGEDTEGAVYRMRVMRPERPTDAIVMIDR